MPRSMMEMQVFGAKASAADIAEMGTRAMAMQPAFAVIRELIQAGFAANFVSEGGVFDESWPPLSDRTIALKGNDAILQASGALRSALEGGAGRRSRAGRTSLSVGIDGKKLFYARFAQGGTEGQGAEPARPIVGISSRDTEASISTMEHYIVSGLGVL